MIGGLSSSLATAVRTAGEARQRMDTAARQIATGQRVASVRDDGAAWTRAAQFQSETVQWQARTDVLDMIKVDLEATQVQVLNQRELWLELRNLVLQARGMATGSQSRVALQAQWNATLEAMDPSGGSTPNFPNAPFIFDNWNSGIALSAGDDFLSGGGNWLVQPDLSAMANFKSQALPTAAVGFSLVSATDAQLDGMRSTIATILGDSSSGGTYLNLRIQEGARDIRRAEQLRQHATVMQDRLASAAGSLLDADIGKASSALRQNETRQQLALQTVRSALDAYGAYAGGLLRNAQQTQRALA